MKGARSCVSCLRTNSLTLATIVGVVTGFVIGVRTLLREIVCSSTYLNRLREFRADARITQPNCSRVVAFIKCPLLNSTGVPAHEGRALDGPGGDVRGVHRQALPPDAQVHHHSTHHPIPNLGRRISR